MRRDRAAFDLCLALGIPHPDYLLGRDSLNRFQERGLTSKQYAGWRAYMTVIPLPMDRQDFMGALLRADIRATHGAKGVDVGELIPRYGQPAKRQRSEAEIKAAWGIK